jgi:hypothetical protein
VTALSAAGGTDMQIPILLEQVANNGYRASSGAPLELTAEANTREEAIAKLREQLQHRMKAGTKIIPLDVPGEPHPLVKYAGMFENNPLFDEWTAEMAEYRRKVEENPDIP